MKLPKHLTLTVAMLVLSPSMAAAMEQSLLYYILDGSGSMWGRAEGAIKIEIAKEVLTGLITDMPEDVQAGLTVYGHRKKGDCADIEELIPAGIIDKKMAVAKVHSISPKGKTPIADSIIQTVERLKDREVATTIVLVSDGIETCGKDPCALTRSLKDSGINFILHVVGFGVSGESTLQLSCIAEAGGGRYLPANNASELLSALTDVKKSVVEKKPLPELHPAPELHKAPKQHAAELHPTPKLHQAPQLHTPELHPAPELHQAPE